MESYFLLILQSKNIGMKINLLLILAIMCVSAEYAMSQNVEVSQYADTLELGEVAVTAIKQSSNVKSLPVASTVLAGEQLERMKVVGMKGASELTPNLFIPDYGSRMTSSVYEVGS